MSNGAKEIQRQYVAVMVKPILTAVLRWLMAYKWRGLAHVNSLNVNWLNVALDLMTIALMAHPSSLHVSDKEIEHVDGLPKNALETVLMQILMESAMKKIVLVIVMVLTFSVV